jgi:putative toxin-antitoxin system antitoxin component (TIGR02293 family)
MTMKGAFVMATAYASAPSRIASILRVENADTASLLTLGDRISRGLSVRSADGLQEFFGHVTDVIPEATLRRARKSDTPLSREMSERLFEIASVVEATLRSYGGDAEDARDFLTRPHAMLDGRTPYEVATASSAGALAVIDLLQAADAGFSV